MTLKEAPGPNEKMQVIETINNSSPNSNLMNINFEKLHYQ